MRRNSFTEGVRRYMTRLRAAARFSSAKSYQDALNSLIRFFGRDEIAYDDITRANLRRYQDDLLRRGRFWNTVSTYMRRVRCVYNQAVDGGEATYVPNLFKEIFTGVESRRKKAVTQEEIRRLITAPVGSPGLRQAQLAVTLMFQYGGMAFVDLSHLRAGNFREGVLDYRRQKTGTPMRILIPEATRNPLQELSSHTRPDSPYLFPFLSGTQRGEAAYREYKSSLARFNQRLRALARAAGPLFPHPPASRKAGYVCTQRYGPAGPMHRTAGSSAASYAGRNTTLGVRPRTRTGLHGNRVVITMPLESALSPQAQAKPGFPPAPTRNWA